MTEPEPEIVIRRVMVALDESAHSRAALESAVALAARMGAELSGLYVEDINLLRLAALPFAREMGFGASAGRPLDPAAMEQALRVQAARLRKRLEEAARVHRLRWSFQVTRGQVAAELLAHTQGADLLILGRCGGSPRRRAPLGSTAQAVVRQAGCSVLVLEYGLQVERPVVVVYDESPSARRALRVSAMLAQEDDNNLVVLIPPLPEGGANTAAEASAADALRGSRLRPRMRHMGRLSTRATMDAVQAEGGRVLVLGVDESLEEQGQPTQWELVGAAGVPVLVVR